MIRLPAACLSALCALSVLLPAARAHAPHDVIVNVAASPDFANDGLVLIRATLLDHRIVGWSDDRGDSWHEVGGPLALHGVNRFAFSPQFSSDGVVFAATEDDGVWRSVDRARHFAPVSVGMPAMEVSSLAVSPGFGTDGVVLATTAAGLFRSADGGASWAPVSGGLTELDLRAVAFGPGDPLPVAFCGGLTMHRSDDLGQTWSVQDSFPSFIQGISVSPGFDQDASAAVCLRLDGVRSTGNGGLLWRPANAGLTDLLTMDVVLTSESSMIVATRSAGVFFSPDLDGPWTLDMSDFEPPDPASSAHYRMIATSPFYASDGTAFVASFEGLFRTQDKGGHWTQLDVFHQLVEIRLAASPHYAQDGQLFVGTYGGGVKLWHDPRPSVGSGPPGSGRSPSGAGGLSLPSGSASLVSGPAQGAVAPPPQDPFGYWEARGNGLISKWCDSVAVSPDFEHDQTLFYGYWGGFRSLDGGRNWTKLTLDPGVQVVRDIAFSPDYANDRVVLFGTNGTGTFRSSDGGDSFLDVGASLPPNVRTRRVRFSPDFANDQTVFLATWDDTLQRSTDGGFQWSPSGAGITESNLRGFAISPDFAADGTLLVGTHGAGVFRSTDRGDSFVPVNDGLEGSGPWSVEAVAFSPDFASDRTAFLATMAGGLYRSLDGGASWQLANQGLPLSALRDVLPSPGFTSDRTLFVASHEGVWRSLDAGDHWQRLPHFARVDDDHPVVLTTGNWIKSASSGAFSSGVSQTEQAGDFTELHFLADQVRWFAPRGPDAAIAEVWIDGVQESLVDLYAPQFEPQSARFERHFAGPAWHTIRIVHSGNANAASSGAWLTSDGWSWQR